MNKQKKVWRKENKIAITVALIPLIGFTIFHAFPIILSFIGLFCNIDLYDLTSIKWNNFEGFKSVFIPGHAFDLFYFDLSKYFYKSIIITLWVGSTQLITLLIALFIATLLRENRPGTKVFQALFFLPSVCSTVAIALMFRWMLEWDGGIINTIFGLDTKWLEDPKTMTWCIIFATIWQAPAYGIVMYKAAFSNINSALYEAAAVDGANAWHKFRYITLPGIRPTTFFLLQSGVTAGFLSYDLAKLIINDSWGVPGGSESMGLTLVRLILYLIGNATTTDANGNSYMVSCACVISWLLFIVTGVLCSIMFRLREKSVE